MSEARKCESCGAKLVEYKHSLSKGLARCLYKIALYKGRAVNLNELKFTYNQQSNFQKLRYWGLVAKEDPNNLKGGKWIITRKGWQFITDEITVPKTAWSFRGDFIRHEGIEIRFSDITDGYKIRPDYYRESVAHWKES